PPIPDPHSFPTRRSSDLDLASMVGKKRALAPAPLDVEPIRVPASLEREPLVVPTTPRTRLNTALCPGTHQAQRTVFLFLVHVLPMSSKLIRASPGRTTARYHACKCPTAVRWSRPTVAVSDGIGRVAGVPSTRDYLFEGVNECVILLWVVEEKSDGERVVRRIGTGGSLVPVRHRSGPRPRCGAVRPKDRIGLGFVDAGRHSTRRRERDGGDDARVGGHDH